MKIYNGNEKTETNLVFFNVCESQFLPRKGTGKNRQNNLSLGHNAMFSYPLLEILPFL